MNQTKKHKEQMRLIRLYKEEIKRLIREELNNNYPRRNDLK